MTSSSKSQRVLVADDDPVFTSLAAASLDRGFEVTVVANGAEALHMLECRAFDLAIVDLDMPCIDGFRLLGLVRGRPSLSRLALLVITSSRLPCDYEEAARLGADAFLAKPIEWAVLPDYVRTLIAAKRSDATVVSASAGTEDAGSRRHARVRSTGLSIP